MEAMTKSPTDQRLDDFREDVNRRFDGVNRQFDEVNRQFDEVNGRFDKVNGRLDRIDDRLDTMNKAIVFGAISLTGGMLAGFAAMTTLVVTQL